MTGALVVYSGTFMRYALAVSPRNYLLFGCHAVNFSAQATQGYRFLNYWKYVFNPSLPSSSASTTHHSILARRNGANMSFLNLDGEVGKPSLPRRALSRARNPLKPAHRETNDLTISFFARVLFSVCFPPALLCSVSPILLIIYISAVESQTLQERACG